jgi:hypothetical protein
MEYTFHTDAGHGWLQVHIDELELYGIADQVSSYSYKNGVHVYLEEDCDATLFINTLENKGIQFKYNTLHTNDDSIIRTFKRY